MIVNFLKLRDASALLHDLQNLEDDLGGRAEKDLALARLLGVVDALKSGRSERLFEPSGREFLSTSSRQASLT